MEDNNSITYPGSNSSYQKRLNKSLVPNKEEMEDLLVICQSEDPLDLLLAKSMFSIIDFRKLSPETIGVLKKYLKESKSYKVSHGLGFMRSVRNKVWNLYGV